MFNNTVLAPMRCTVRGLVVLTASSAKGVRLVVAFAKAGGSFRHTGEGSLSERKEVSECSGVIERDLKSSSTHLVALKRLQSR